MIRSLKPLTTCHASAFIHLRGAKRVEIDEPYLRAPHQVQNFVRFCEVVAAEPTVKEVALTTGYVHDAERDELEHRLSDLAESLKDFGIALRVDFNPHLHDREIRIDNGWTVKIGRGLDIYQKPHSRFELGAHNLDLRRCLETKVDIFKSGTGTDYEDRSDLRLRRKYPVPSKPAKTGA